MVHGILPKGIKITEIKRNIASLWFKHFGIVTGDDNQTIIDDDITDIIDIYMEDLKEFLAMKEYKSNWGNFWTELHKIKGSVQTLNEVTHPSKGATSPARQSRARVVRGRVFGCPLRYRESHCSAVARARCLSPTPRPGREREPSRADGNAARVRAGDRGAGEQRWPRRRRRCAGRPGAGSARARRGKVAQGDRRWGRR